MAVHNVSARGLVVVLLGLAVCGCQGWSNQRQPVRPTPPRETADRTPAPPLPAPLPPPRPAPAEANPTKPLQIPGPAAAPDPAKGASAPRPLEMPPEVIASPAPRPEVQPDTTPTPAVKVTAPPSPSTPTPPTTTDAAKASPTPAAPVVSIQPPPPPVPVPGTPEPSVPANDPASQLRRLHQEAERAASRLDACTARFTRREQVNGKEVPEEVIDCKFRREPLSVHLKWVGDSFKGREVVYVRGQYDGKINTWLAAKDRIFGPFMKRSPPMSPDDPMVRSRSRHPITNAGPWSPVSLFGQLVAALEKGDKRYGTLAYLGPQMRPEYKKQMEAVEHTIPAGAEAALPGGGKRLWFFDPDTHLPLLVTTHDDKGHQVEYYCYTDMQPATGFGDEDFNPDKLWAGRQ